MPARRVVIISLPTISARLWRLPGEGVFEMSAVPQRTWGLPVQLGQGIKRGKG